jgi:hypothetical protein
MKQFWLVATAVVLLMPLLPDGVLLNTAASAAGTVAFTAEAAFAEPRLMADSVVRRASVAPAFDAAVGAQDGAGEGTRRLSLASVPRGAIPTTRQLFPAS